MVSLTGLNPQQREAVEQTEGPLLVLAGAGSGKTRVITFRIAHLLSRGVSPKEILALSFTNKAANEMKERLIGLVGKKGEQCVTSTFHSLGVRFLKREYEAAGLRPRFSIIDEADQLDAVRQVMTQLQLDPKKEDPKELLAQIHHFKTQLINPTSIASARTSALCYQGYLRRLRVMNAVDFEDLIRLPVVLMETNSAVQKHWRTRFKYIMVDEYQDTNGAQLRMLKQLAAGHKNICVVGDDDQSIYGWRGAVASNILRFDQHFEGARLIALTQNYRSTNYILRAANHVIENNPERHKKTLWSEHGDGEQIRFRLLDNGADEADWVAQDLLSTKIEHQLAWNNFAILYRTNLQARIFEESLRNLNIPYRVIGGTQYYDRKEVRDALAYLQLIANPLNENALRRIINYPQRGIGDQTIERLSTLSQTSGQPMFSFCAEPELIPGVSTSIAHSLRTFHHLISDLSQRFDIQPWSETFDQMLSALNFKRALAKDYKDTSQVNRRWHNLEALSQSLKTAQERKRDSSLSDFLNRILIDRPKPSDGEQPDEVSMMSLHSSKGLEFLRVYLVGVEEEWMPHAKVLDEGGSVEEERRLMYVGITRAQRHLTITNASSRLRYGKLVPRELSRFLTEIPEEYFLDGLEGGTTQLSAEEEEAYIEDAFDKMFAMFNKK